MADQKVSVEHVIVDGGSTDGTVELLERLTTAASGRDARRSDSQRTLRWVSRPNRGMYDGLNLGLALCEGEWVGFVNADDQLLDGALSAVDAAIEQYPTIDIWYGDLLVIRPDGSLVAWRKTIRPLWWLIAGTDLYVPSSGMVIRRTLLAGGPGFDPTLRTAGDEKFVVELFRRAPSAQRLPRPIAVFTWSGHNQSLSAAARAESMKLKQEYAWWIRNLRPLWRLVRKVMKVAAGAWRPPQPLTYSVYVGDNLAHRVSFTVQRPQWRWSAARR